MQNKIFMDFLFNPIQIKTAPTKFTNEKKTTTNTYKNLQKIIEINCAKKGYESLGCPV